MSISNDDNEYEFDFDNMTVELRYIGSEKCKMRIDTHGKWVYYLDGEWLYSPHFRKWVERKYDDYLVDKCLLGD